MMPKENVRSFGGSLFGSLYQKFEVVCQEVDDIVNHEHRKVLENRVQTVGGNLIKFCSNVKDLIPLNSGAPLKDVEQSVKSNSEDGDGECSSAADAKQFPQHKELKQLSEILDPRFTDSFLIDQNFHSFIKEKQPSTDETELITPNNVAPLKYVEQSELEDGECSSVADAKQFLQQIDLNFIDNPSSSSSGLLQVGQSESFSINQDCDSEELKQTSETSDQRFSDSFLIDQNFHSFTEEKQPVSDETEFITLNFGAPLKEVEQFVKINPELEDGDGDCYLNFIDNPSNSSSGLLQLMQSESFSINQDCGFLAEELKQPSEEASGPRFTDNYLTDQDLLSFTEEKQPIRDETVKNSDLFTEKEDESLLTFPDEDPCESSMFHNQDFSSSASIHSSGYEIHKKEDPFHENSPSFEVYVKAEMISDINHKLSQESELLVEEETSPSLMTNTITYPLLHFSDHTETESPKDNIGTTSSSFPPLTSQEFTEVPINSPRDSEGLKLKLPGKSKLDESCVFVQNDGNHIDLFAVERNWTYKKKIRNPFTSRKKLEKEYKRLSLYYCDIDAEFNEVAGDKIVPLSHNDKHKNPSAQDLQDSEWEFV